MTFMHRENLAHAAFLKSFADAAEVEGDAGQAASLRAEAEQRMLVAGACGRETSV